MMRLTHAVYACWFTGMAVFMATEARPGFAALDAVLAVGWLIIGAKEGK